MEYWEFLIQQEGDQTWLPLETKQVEILEGRYRVAVHTSRANTPVEIRVSHLVLDEIPPRRRVRKRKGITNDSGLIIIFPYMGLKPGRWEIRCSGDDVMDDLLGAGWEEGVQLQVVPRDDDWEPDWSVGPEGANTGAANVGIENTGVVDKSLQLATQPVQARQPHGSESVSSSSLTSSAVPNATDALARSEVDVLSQNIVDEMFQGVDQALTSSTNPIASAQAHLKEAAADSDYRLQLEQQAYVSPLGQPLTLKGQIFREVGTSLSEAQLSIQLRDPETAQILFETRQYLAPQPIPAHFELNIPLPTHLQTRVILGAVALRAEHGEASVEVLASSAFTITAGLDQLLDAIASQPNPSFEEEISIYPGTTEPFVKPEESPATLISPDLPLSEVLVQSTAPSEGMTLPPKIYQPEDSERKQSSPELPDLPAKPSPDDVVSSADEAISETVEGVEDLPATSEVIAPDDTELDDGEAAADEGNLELPDLPVPASAPASTFRGPALFDDDNVEDDDLESELAVAALEEADYESDELEPSPNLDAFDRGVADKYQPEVYSSEETSVGDTEQQDSAFDGEMAAAETVDPIFVQLDQSFQSLNLQERFWDRLTALTYDGYNAASELKEAMDAAGVSDPSRAHYPSDETLSPTASSESSATDSAAESPAPAPSSAPNREVVVYDDPTPEDVTPLSATTLNAKQVSGQFVTDKVGRVPNRFYEEPVEIASPTLEVPNHDLTAGELVPIIIRLPRPNDYRPYVKVWMNDLQTRTVIDDPRLLMHFTPNQQGELETLMRIKVPLGCLEIQFAAIVINMATLQESAKVVVNRHVIPPDLPSVSLDDI